MQISKGNRNEQARREFKISLSKCPIGISFFNYQRLLWNQSGPNSIQRKRMHIALDPYCIVEAQSCSTSLCQFVRGEDRAPCLTGRYVFGYQLCCATCCTLVRCQLARGETRIVSYTFVSFVMSTVDIVEMKVCQFQRDRDEQARRKFEFVPSIFTSQFATRIVHHSILRGV